MFSLPRVAMAAILREAVKNLVKTGDFQTFTIVQNDKEYLKRFYLTRPNKDNDLASFLRKLGLKVYLHEFYDSDNDRHLHSHPWPFMSIILDGAYEESTPQPGFLGIESKHRCRATFEPGEINVHADPTDYHSIRILTPRVTTLIIAGEARFKWGFLTEDGHVNAADYIGDMVERNKAREEKSPGFKDDDIGPELIDLTKNPEYSRTLRRMFYDKCRPQ